MLDRLRHPLVAVAGALLLTIPWVVTFVSYGGYMTVHPGENIAPLRAVAVAGLAVLGASFLLAWGAETAEKDVPQAFAIAVLAVLAVAPEYAVDALYAWNAGAFEGTQQGMQAANLAVANMTGANRILIGLGWSAIALFTVYQARHRNDPAVSHRDGFLTDAVTLDRGISTEIAFLLVATLFAFLVPLSLTTFGGGSIGGIGLLDTVVLVGLYVLYIAIIIRGDVEESEEHVGVPAYLQSWSKGPRVASVLGLFAYSGTMIFIAVEPFAVGLEQLGLQYGIPEFFMIQWLAPLASESPELIVVAYLVNKARSTAGFNALISSKLNQWTLLIGTLVVVYSIGLGTYGTLPFDAKQQAEIWITAAQSLFAIAILVNLNISLREAIVLLVLFLTQVFVEFLIIRDLVAFPFDSYELLVGYTVVYVILAVGLFVARREALRQLVARAVTTAQTAFRPSDQPSTSD
jgi:cation:H+ antiporter